MNHTKKKVKINTDRLTGFFAIVISLLTLFIFLYQTNLLKEQSRLSVRPRLTFSKNIDNVITLNESDSIQSKVINMELTITNNGLGPAIIESNKVVDKNIEYNILTFFYEAYPKLKEYGDFNQITELKIGEAIAASETKTIFSYTYDIRNENKIKAYLKMSKTYDFPFTISIEYSSMYEEKWKIDSNTEGHPLKLN